MAAQRTSPDRWTMRGNRAVLAMAVVSLASLVATIVLIEVSRDWPKPTPIAGDPTLYGEIADAILAGGVPYIDVTVEHLPVLLVPILVVGVASNLLGLDYAALWPLVTIGAVVASVGLAGRIDLVPRYQTRYAVAAAPMVPLIIYRLEVFVVILALLAIGAFARGHLRTGAWTSVAGALAKGWPIVLLVVPFRKGAIRLAAVTTGTSVALLALVASLPGFRDGRAFTGIHSETIVGNLLLLVRHATGADLGLVGAAGATYVEAPAAAVLVNAAIGVAIGLVALVAALRTTDLVPLLRICGLATLAVMLVSPLFSAQFVFWLTPFVPLLTLTGRRIAFVAGLLSMLLVAFWNPFEGWWAIEVALRNVAIVVLAGRWVVEVQRREASEATPLANEHVA